VKRWRTVPKRGFHVMGGTRRSQAAGMAIAPGISEGGPGNAHAARHGALLVERAHRADQWLYVLSGTGTAFVGRKKTALKTGTLLLIAKGEKHEIRNTGRRPLRALNVYAPPAY